MEAKNTSTIIGTADTWTTVFTCDNTEGRFINCYSICNPNSNPTNVEVALYDASDTLLCKLYSFVLPYNSTFERKALTPIEDTQKIKVKTSLTDVHCFIGYAII